MAGIAAATLTGAGFSAGAAGAGPSGGTTYTITVGAFNVTVVLYTEVEGAGFSGYAQVQPNSDTNPADAQTVAGLLSSIGLGGLSTYPGYPGGDVSLQLLGLGAQDVYSQSF